MSLVLANQQHAGVLKKNVHASGSSSSFATSCLQFYAFTRMLRKPKFQWVAVCGGGDWLVVFLLVLFGFF